MQTQRVSLSRLNEMVTETQEARPDYEPRGSREVSALSYWIAQLDVETLTRSWVPYHDFTADEGAILRLIDQCEHDLTIQIGPRGRGRFLIEAWWRKSSQDTWLQDEWDNSNCALAPALCCAYLFALSGIRYEIDD